MTTQHNNDDAAWREVAAQWQFAEGIVYLNHGSFGPAPRPVIAARKWEGQPRADRVACI